MIRLAIAAAVVAVVVLGTLWYRRGQARDAARGGVGLPDLPVELRGTAPTWVVFTTPYCASCSAVEAQLHEAFPHHRVVVVDATERPELAERYDVRRAPTTVLAGTDGVVLERLVGPEHVRSFIGTADAAALI